MKDCSYKDCEILEPGKRTEALPFAMARVENDIRHRARRPKVAFSNYDWDPTQGRH